MWTVMIMGDYQQAAIKFETESDARAWAKRYCEAFKSHKVWLVQGEARVMKHDDE